jgi:hypothetical protein
MAAWKRKNTAREVKGSADASLRADLKSKASQATKNAGEFQIQKRGFDMLTHTFAGAKKAKPTPIPVPVPISMEEIKVAEGRVGRVDDDDALCKDENYSS